MSLEAVLSITTLGVLGLGSWLLPKYLEARVAEAARGAIDLSVGKALAEHRFGLDTQLEDYRVSLGDQAESLRQSLAFERERYARDYGLFAQRRNEVYADVFGLLEKVRGGYGQHFAKLLSHRTFDTSVEPDLRALAGSLELVTDAERLLLLSALDRGDLTSARKTAAELVERSSLRAANRAFFDFRNACVLHTLYFSPEIDLIIPQILAPLALLSVHADELIAGDHGDGRDGRARGASVDEADGATARLRSQMRSEMQAGFALATPATTVAPRPNGAVVPRHV